jgi:hypothetical protein
MGAASALGRDASILSPLSQAFGADEQRVCRLPLAPRLLLNATDHVANNIAPHRIGHKAVAPSLAARPTVRPRTQGPPGARGSLSQARKAAGADNGADPVRGLAGCRPQSVLARPHRGQPAAHSIATPGSLMGSLRSPAMSERATVGRRARHGRPIASGGPIVWATSWPAVAQTHRNPPQTAGNPPTGLATRVPANRANRPLPRGPLKIVVSPVRFWPSPFPGCGASPRSAHDEGCALALAQNRRFPTFRGAEILQSADYNAHNLRAPRSIICGT